MLFAAMSVIWGIPYLLIKVAVAELSPAAISETRNTPAAWPERVSSSNDPSTEDQTPRPDSVRRWQFHGRVGGPSRSANRPTIGGPTDTTGVSRS